MKLFLYLGGDKMKKRLSTVIFLAFMVLTMFSLVGCSSGSSESVSNDEVREEDLEVKADEKEESQKGKRSSPIDLGETVKWQVKFYADISDWDSLTGLANFTLNKVYEGEEALDMLYFGSGVLDDIEEGYSYAVAHMIVELVEGHEDSPYTTSFSIGSVSEDGRKSPSSYSLLADKYEENDYTDLYPGGKVDLMKAFLIPKDSDYLIEIEENISGSKFFKNK